MRVILITAIVLLLTISSTFPYRWGQASALSGDYLIIHGGKTNGDGGYTFTSGINTGEILMLDLTSTFAANSPPWLSINASSTSTASPSVAFHSLFPLDQSSQMMVFGGDVSQTAASLTSNDSAYMLDLSSSYKSAFWSAANSTWNQPERRIHQSASSDGKGSVWIVGGERDDGSYLEMDELWMFNSTTSSPTFEQQDTPVGGLVGSTSTLMNDGSLLVLGGQNSTSMQSFDKIAYYSTTSKKWSTISTKGVNDTEQGYPSPRLGHIAVRLPRQRVFIHGGATSNWLEAMGDAWILDWSQDPPTWSEISTSSSNSPSARFGHSAVARGEMIVLTFGWGSNNPADAGLYIFDASSLTSASGVWSGGSWDSTYTPDASVSSGTSTSNGGNNANSNESSGDSNSSKGNSGSSSSTLGNHSPSSSNHKVTPSDSPKTNSSDNSSGEKAGAALGALLGVGLIAGAGYLVYRKRHPTVDKDEEDFAYGDGTGLLRGTNHYYGADDDPRILEKSREYTGVGAGGIASFQPGTRPMGPRIAPQSEMASSPWSMANIGHAMEGSGPHLREKLALMTGIGLGGAAAARQQQRFDMLADEDDLDREHRQGATAGTEEVDDDDDERYNGVARRMRERSYGRVDQFDEDEVENSMGDLAGIGAHYRGGEYVTSPFEDATRRSREELEEGEEDETSSFVCTMDTGGDISDNTSQSRNHSNSSTAAQHSHSSASQAPEIVSFSDSSNQRRVKRNGTMSSPLVRRSPTWWDRFMGQSFLERSASGQLHPGPRAEEPIRDPTEPPALTAIHESRRSINPSEDYNPFIDNSNIATTDEMGRFLDIYSDKHSRSMSSVQSGKTMTSSVMEARMQNMDVVQRAGTASSRRTYGSSRSGSDGLSRGTSMRSSAGHLHTTTPSESMPGSVIFDPSEWNNHGQLPDTMEEEAEDVSGMHDDTSMDIVNLDQTPVLEIGVGRKRANTSEAPRMPTTIADSGSKRTKMEDVSGTKYHGYAAKVREASDAPSLTPSTTKRARQNRQLTSPVSPQPHRKMAPVVRGSVLDRVKAIEKKRVDEGEAHLPIPRSPAAVEFGPPSPDISLNMEKAHMFVPGRGGRPILTKLTTAGEEMDDSFVASPLQITSPISANREKVRYSHGLVPKPQLFVANPDGRQGSSDS